MPSREIHRKQAAPIESDVRGDPRKIYKIPSTGKFPSVAPIIDAMEDPNDLTRLKDVSEKGKGRVLPSTIVFKSDKNYNSQR